jgi:hypothetical protein
MYQDSQVIPYSFLSHIDTPKKHLNLSDVCKLFVPVLDVRREVEGQGPRTLDGPSLNKLVSRETHVFTR